MSKKSEYVRQHRLKQAEYVRNHKRKPCTDCGIQYPYWVMEFDHVRGVKQFQLSYVTRTNVSRKRIDDELAKCEVVCRNCHALRHPPAYQKEKEDD